MQTRAQLQKKGTPIGAMDLLIASHALFINTVLVTNNTREFERVPDLKIENWLFWILGDVLVIPMFAIKGLAFTSVQYIVFLVLAIMAYIEWRKRLKLKKIL